MITGKCRVHNLKGEDVLGKYRSANDQVAALNEVLKIFYNGSEMFMLYDSARSQGERLYETYTMTNVNDFYKSKGLTSPYDAHENETDKKSDVVENMHDKALELLRDCEDPTDEDYESQAKAEAGIADESDDSPYDSTSQAIYGRRYQESHKDGVTPEQMDAIDEAMRKAYEETDGQ